MDITCLVQAGLYGAVLWVLACPPACLPAHQPLQCTVLSLLHHLPLGPAADDGAMFPTSDRLRFPFRWVGRRCRQGVANGLWNALLSAPSALHGAFCQTLHGVPTHVLCALLIPYGPG